jgi:hypothetical protein
MISRRRVGPMDQRGALRAEGLAPGQERGLQPAEALAGGRALELFGLARPQALPRAPFP